MKNFEMSWQRERIRVAIRLAQETEGNHNESSCKPKDRNAPFRHRSIRNMDLSLRFWGYFCSQIVQSINKMKQLLYHRIKE